MPFAPVENPYLPDRGQQLVTMLMSLGQGITAADAAGRSPLVGLGAGAGLYGQAVNEQAKLAMAYDQWQQQFQQQEAYRQAQEDNLKEQAAARRQENEATAKAFEYLKGMGLGGTPVTPGMGAPATQPSMGPGRDYFTVTGAAESGNNYTVRNKIGSGAYGKYQFMPDTWAAVAQANPHLGLPFNMAQSTADQQEAAMRAFTEGNARSLAASGIQPTPDNLYLAHRFGVEGAKKVLSADPNAPISGLFPAQYTQQNPDMSGATVGAFRQGVQQRFGGIQPVQYSGNPQIAPQSGPSTVQPPRVDPLQYAPLMISKTLAPLGQAMIGIGNSETERYLKDLERNQNQEQFNRRQIGRAHV